MRFVVDSLLLASLLLAGSTRCRAFLAAGPAAAPPPPRATAPPFRPARVLAPPLYVSIGLGPGEDDKDGDSGGGGDGEGGGGAGTTAATATAEEAEAVAIEEPDHELFRTSRLTDFDGRCDEWYGSLLGFGADAPSFLGSVSDEARRRITTLPELKHEPRLQAGKDPEWTPYRADVLPGSPLLPSYGLEQYGLPVPRKNAETWRHFDVAGMVETDYSGSPEGVGTDLDLDDAEMSRYKSILAEKGAWLDDDSCSGRLVYVDGRYCPALSKPTDHVRNLSPSDFNPSSDSADTGMAIRDELLECLGRLPDGFTDRLAADVPSGDAEFLTSLKALSGPDHNIGEPTSQFAVNNQQGTACFAALNSVRAGAVALVDLPAGTDAGVEDPKPVLIINAQTADMGCSDDGSSGNGEKGVACHPRSLAVVGEGSKASLVQSCVDLDLDGGTDIGDKAKLQNGYTQIFVKGGANLTHAYLEETGGIVTSGVEGSSSSSSSVADDENIEGTGTKKSPREVEAARPALRNTHLEAIDVHVTGDGGSYTGAIMGLGGNGRSRVAVSAHLLRPGAHASLNGFVLAGGAQRTETKTNIHHVAQGTTSQQTQRNMVGGRATASFRGRIRVEQSAQQTDSNQLSRTVLLSDRARIWTVPSLEIIADDVQCTHGATVSDLSEEELFYLRSRGVDRETARNILMYAFVDEVGRSVPPAIRGSDDDDAGLKRRCIRRLQNVVPQGDRAIRGEFQSV